MEIHYKTDDEIHALVSAFEACSFHPSEFRHYQHLTVALWYVWHHSPAEAAAKMTKGIRRLAETYGKMGYHETITLFWLRIVANFVAEHRPRTSLTAVANALIGSCNDKDLIGRFYSAKLLATDKAKAEWVEPDLKVFAGIESDSRDPDYLISSSFSFACTIIHRNFVKSSSVSKTRVRSK